MAKSDSESSVTDEERDPRRRRRVARPNVGSRPPKRSSEDNDDAEEPKKAKKVERWQDDLDETQPVEPRKPAFGGRIPASVFAEDTQDTRGSGPERPTTATNAMNAGSTSLPEVVDNDVPEDLQNALLNRWETKTEYVPSPRGSPRREEGHGANSESDDDEGELVDKRRATLVTPTLCLHSSSGSEITKKTVVETAVPVLDAFLRHHDDIDIVICEHDSETFALWQAKLEETPLNSLALAGRIRLLPCNLAKTRTEGHIEACDAVVVESTWRAKPLTDAGRALCDLAGKDVGATHATSDLFMQEVKSKFPGGVAKVGFVVPILAKIESVLRVEEGVKALLFTNTVLSEGIATQVRGNEKIDDPIQVIKTSWLGVLSMFEKEFGPGIDPSRGGSPVTSPKSNNAFAVMMDAAKSKSVVLKDQAEFYRPSTGPRLASKAPVPSYLDVLRKYIVAPENFTETEFSDEEIVIISDAYPKARRHFLVMPRLLNVNSVTELRANDIPLLRRMKERAANTVVRDSVKGNPGMKFLIGFHAIPSLHCLHMHVISTDFDGRSMKTKRHWNTFNTAFFRPIDDVIKELSAKGKVTINVKQYEDLEKGPMSCPQHNNVVLPNMKAVHEHVEKYHN